MIFIVESELAYVDRAKYFALVPFLRHHCLGPTALHLWLPHPRCRITTRYLSPLRLLIRILLAFLVVHHVMISWIANMLC